MSRLLVAAVGLSVVVFSRVTEAQPLPLLPPPPPPPPSVTIRGPDGAAPATIGRGSSRIRGRVTDAANGRPVRRAMVRLMMSSAARQPRMAMTDVEGRYEFADLPAGSYSIHASKATYVALTYGQTRPQEIPRPFELSDRQFADRVDIALPQGSVITGRVLDEFGDPVVDAMVTPMRNQYGGGGGPRPSAAGRGAQTNDIGEFRVFGLAPGNYYISAALRPGPSFPDVADDRVGYSPTFFPSTANAAEAHVIKIGVGQIVTDVTIVLLQARTASVSGIALDLDGTPMRGGSVSIMHRSAAMMAVSTGGQIRADGTFAISGVVPGQYVLRTFPANPGGQAVFAVGIPFTVAPLRIFSTAVVDVNGEDVTGVVLTAPKPANVSGRITGDAAALQRLNPGQVRINVQYARPDDNRLGMPSSGPVAVQEDLTFSFQVLPGAMVLRPFAPGGLTLKAIRFEGADVTDRPFEFKDGADVRDIEIELTNRPQTVEGMVTGSSGPAPGSFTVILFSDDRERWMPPTRFVAIARPDAEGKYSSRSLPPGSYLAVAVGYVEPGQWTDPEYLESLQPRATRFMLNEGETRTLDLKLAMEP